MKIVEKKEVEEVLVEKNENIWYGEGKKRGRYFQQIEAKGTNSHRGAAAFCVRK